MNTAYIAGTAASPDIGFQLAPVALCVTQQRVIASCNVAFVEVFSCESGELLGQAVAMLYLSPQAFHIIGQRGN